PEPATASAPMERGVPRPDQAERMRISPLARRIAEENNVDLRQVRGTGPGGRIVQEDVLALVEKRAAPTPAPSSELSVRAAPAQAVASPTPLPARVESGQRLTISLNKMRAVIAQRLQQAKQTIPHFYETIDVDAEQLSQLRQRLNTELESDRIRLSLGDLVTKALATALLRHPALNATFSGNEITRYGDVNLGMAVALPDGLIVPVLRNVGPMGLKEIRMRSEDLVERARAQKLRQDELSGATFTVSNLGMYGVREFAAIINPPEVGLLAVGAAEKRPVVRGDVVVPRMMMTLTLSADHRAVDGATAAEFLRTLKHLLEEPGMMLM
ncbi:MAG: dihydrolipoamide acetyltransferase family protein, partial [Tepidisphaeraceae bacterium]